jgi:hypothetical protein
MSERQFDLWLEFEHWLPQEDDDPENDFFNMTVTLPEGKKYALNVWTFKYLSRAVQECRMSGEHRSGSYLPAPDLFVERLNRRLLEDVVADLLARGGLSPQWEVQDQTDAG